MDAARVESTALRAEYGAVADSQAADMQAADARRHRGAVPDTIPCGPARDLCAYLSALIHAYRQTSGTSVPAEVATQRAAELQLAEAVVRLARSKLSRPAARPPQLVVLGPTQTGKSTVVNLLLGAPAAAVSPLAGFTVHAHGFATSGEIIRDAWTDTLFPGWPRRRAEEMERAELEAFSLEPVGPDRCLATRSAGPPGPAEPEAVGHDRDGATAQRGALHYDQGLPSDLPPCVVWDTPDFDSLAWYEYRRGVLETVALADVLVLVLSREKYADLAVWRMLRLIEPLGRPLVVALNKMTSDAQDTIVASLRERLAETSDSWRDAPICPLPYSPGSAAPPGDALRQAAHELRRVVAGLLPDAARRPSRPGVARLLRRHWQMWAEPIAAEHAASLAWRELVEAVLEEVLESYRRDFLEHPQRYDTFRRVTVELLHLLELPGLAGVVHEVRRVVTWPARQLFAAGREWWLGRRPDAARRRLVGEELVLHEIIEHMLVRLERDASRRAAAGLAGAGLWRALVRRLEQEEARLRVCFQQAGDDHRREFEGEVRAAAERLYRALQDSPVLLGGLRAARASADVAALALAIKTGGAPLHDLLLAPAMLAVSSLLTEGALGGYVHRVAEELKRRQFERVRQTLVEGVFGRELNALTKGLSGDELFGVDFEQMRSAAEALDRWEQDANE
jgi:hypothetical protein